MRVFSLKIIIFLCIIVCLVLFVMFVFPWILIYIGGALKPNPPVPQITYGEFPFRLEYEIDGENFIIEDTVICEYDGIGWNEGTGKHRKWKSHLASGNDEIVLLLLDNGTKIFFPIGSADFYMGDLAEYEAFSFTFPDAFIYDKKGTNFYNRRITAEEMSSNYNLKLNDWNFTEPIVNSFK